MSSISYVEMCGCFQPSPKSATLPPMTKCWLMVVKDLIVEEGAMPGLKS